MCSCLCAVAERGGGKGEKEGDAGRSERWGCWVNELRVGSYSHNKEKNSRKNPISLSLSLSAYNFHSLAFSIESQ